MREATQVQTALPGIHHVTAFSSDPQQNHDFYAELLGLRLLKVTVNFDDPSLYHLYYGDGTGSAGTAITFFPIPRAVKGRIGRGQAAVTRFSAPKGSISCWTDRLLSAGIPVGDPVERFGDLVLDFEDPDGLRLAIVEPVQGEARPGWEEGPVPAAHSLRSFHSVEVDSLEPDASIAHLESALGFTRVQESDRAVRMAAPGAEHGAYADVLKASSSPFGRMGAGTVHHVAWRARTAEDQEFWRQKLENSGQGVTSVRNRCYFQSIYSPEPGGVLYEVATDGPGFDADEPLDALGMELKLPDWLESRRSLIRAKLPSFRNSAGVSFP